MTLLVLAPLRLEALAARSGLRGTDAEVVRTGMGPARSRAAAEALSSRNTGLGSARPVAVAGVCGGVEEGLCAGDVVVATAVRTEDGAERELSQASVLALADAVRGLGLRCTTGTVLSVERLHGDARRAAAGQESVVAVDMESAWLADAAGDGPFAVLRVVADAGGRSVYRPRTLVDGTRALTALRRAVPAIAEWSQARTID